MSQFREAYRAMVLDTLRCPKCPAMNRPGARLIQLDETGSRACCDQCGAEGPLDRFQPKETDR